MTSPGHEVKRIFVELLDEGVTCLRPTFATPISDGTYRLLPSDDYDPEIESWAFLPGSLVRCREEHWDGELVLVAREKIE